ncbi:F-box/LRR-repeat protein 20 [Lepeophtheirus salmonis]|uniref:F-box/LRR-repeat protein 20 n=1 Tax=Lepeophtheirus salmonis TaxID=72036 RepID=UPI001AE60E74|nr:F-box/LRR-repeat protein 20-like [Lepeophtheirus salmonis]XP_040571300.1 F-box/LRR-repeat protein 20-like [Lepeophtheirus salmonis]
MTRYGRETNGHSSSSRKSSGSIKPSGIPSTNNGFTNSHHNNNNPHTSDVYQVSRNGSTANSWSKLGNRVFGEGDESLINRKLPKELLLRIFSHLDVVSLCRCAQVSKSWNVLALDGSNWQRVDLFEFQIDIEGVVVENIARRCGGFLRELSLRGCQAVGDNALATFSQHCNNIESLNLKYCKKITDRTAQSLSLYCHKLQYLDLSSCSAISDLSLTALSQGCNNIYHLDISWCDLVTAKGLKALSDGCRKLQHFISKGCLHISDEALIHLARNCKLLQTVNIQGCRNVQDDGVILLAENCPDLRYLCVSNCGHLTDSTLLALASNCPQLSKLECAAVSQLTDTGFQALAKNCHLLERLDLEECVLITDATLSVLSAYCPRMESVSLSHCELITDEGIRQLGLSPCSSEHLTVLELDNLPLITDTSLDHLVSCHNMQRIELYDCQLITRAGIRRLRNHLPNIKVHAYFAPATPPPSAGGPRQRYCRCCIIL